MHLIDVRFQDLTSVCAETMTRASGSRAEVARALRRVEPIGILSYILRPTTAPGLTGEFAMRSGMFLVLHGHSANGP